MSAGIIVDGVGLSERFWSKVRHNDATGCWEWTASVAKGGYGRFHAEGRSFPAHRVSYCTLVGDVPPGLVLDHLCRVPACVNPYHLDPVPQRINVLRGNLPAVARSKTNAERCRTGRHAWIPANIYTSPDGRRECRPCANKHIPCGDCGLRMHSKNLSRHRRLHHG